MNRFKDAIEELRQRPAAKQAQEILKNLPKNGRLGIEPRDRSRYRLPYSSDPEPIDEAWKNEKDA
jgi:hypothetical protein